MSFLCVPNDCGLCVYAYSFMFSSAAAATSSYVYNVMVSTSIHTHTPVQSTCREQSHHRDSEYTAAGFSTVMEWQQCHVAL